MLYSPSSGKKELVRRTSSYHTSGVGTQAYGAPEQLLHGIIDDKSDVYSLGIVLFEMFHPFGTTMERSREDTAFYRHTLEIVYKVTVLKVKSLVKCRVTIQVSDLGWVDLVL